MSKKRIFAAGRPIGFDDALGYDATIRQAVEAAVPFLESGFEDQPRLKARLIAMIGISFRALGDYELAKDQFEASHAILLNEFGADHPLTWDVMRRLAAVYQELGHHDDAMELSEKSLKYSIDTFGESHTQYGPWSSPTSPIRSKSKGNYSEAVKLYQKAIQLMEAASDGDPEMIAVCKANLANTYGQLGRFNDAIDLHKEAYEYSELDKGRNHPDALSYMHGLAHAYELDDQVPKAITLHQECYNLMKERLAPYHPTTLNAGKCMVRLFEKIGKYESAITIQKEVLQWRETKLGPAHTETIRNKNDLSINYIRLRQHDKALELSEKLYEICENTLGGEHAYTLQCMTNLVSCYQGLIGGRKRRRLEGNYWNARSLCLAPIITTRCGRWAARPTILACSVAIEKRWS